MTTETQTLIKRIQDALGTAEEGDALVEVALNAHLAEMELAARKRADEEADEIYGRLVGAQEKLKGYDPGGFVWDAKSQAFRVRAK
jgi:hypothetical protein